MSLRETSAREAATGSISDSRPDSISSETSLHPERRPSSILRRTSTNSTTSQRERLPPTPISRRSSRVRFSESGRPTSIASSSSSIRRTSTSSTNLGCMSDLEMIQARRLSRASSDHGRIPSPSDFAPRPLPMPRYNGPPAESYAPDLRKSKSVRPRPSADGLRADLDAHRLSVSDIYNSYSTSSSPSASIAGSSRRSSARFSIISDPRDLDMLTSLGGAPDIDEFFNQSLPSLDSSLDDLDLLTSPPPTLPLPSPSKRPSRVPDLDTKLFVTPTIAARSRALSPIHGEDESTPVPRVHPAFPKTQGPMDMLSPDTMDDETPLARQARSPIGMTPLMAFPIPPPRTMSFDGLHSTLFDEIDKLVASESAIVSSVSSGLLQPAPTLSVGSTSMSPLVAHEAPLPDLKELETTGEASDSSDQIAPVPKDDQDPVSEDEGAPILSESEGYEPSEAVTEDTDTEKELLSDASNPSSPGINELMNNFRDSQLRAAECYEDDEPDYEVPLYEAAVRAGILSSRSQLLWPSKPKRRTFIPPRLAVPITQTESTGWSGSESEEEEFNEVLANIARRRKLAQKAATKQRLTPPKELTEHRSSLRLSMISESSTSSASSIEILTPDPHRTRFVMGPYDPLNTPTPTRLSVAPRSWSASKASHGLALGIPVPIRRASSVTRVLPAPKRQVKGWGKPEILLEDDEAPLVASSSEEEEDQKAKRASTPTSGVRKGKAASVDEDSPLRLTMIGRVHDEAGGVDREEDDWLMDETEPEFEAGQFHLVVPPTRYLGIPF